MTAALALAAAVAGVLSAGAGLAAQPRTAIPWLSDSVTAAAPPTAPRARPKAEASPQTATITVTPLEPINRDAVGLLEPRSSGLPRALWRGAAAAEVRDAILAHPDQGVPAARAVFRRLLLAEADPPEGSGPEAAVLIARIDRLLDLGALEEAEALLVSAGPETPELFRRWFDIGLLTNRSESQCAALRQNPALSPTLPARVFCLARGGDWNAAEITLTLGQGVGAISPEQEALLARFLDPVIFEDEPEPAIPRPLTPLDFSLREAVGLPRPLAGLPRAFLQGDLDIHAPMRVRINAAERLVLAGALDAQVLMEAYRAGEPAASGGIWDRARAVQALDAALAPGSPDPLGPALAAADTALAGRGLRVAFAEAYAPMLAGLDPAAPPPEDRIRRAELHLLAGDPAAAARAAGPSPDARLAGLLAIADPALGTPQPPDALARAALGGLTERRPAGERETRLAATITEGAPGLALIEALDLLAQGPAIDPVSLETALFTLCAAGQRDLARQVALQTLLLPNAS